jgi:uncharacterized protein
LTELGLNRQPAAVQWLILAALSAALAALLHWAGIPAAFFMGPMIAGVIVGANGGTVRAPRAPYVAAQTIMGLFLSSAITPGVLGSFLQEWPVFLGAVFLVLSASAGLGWAMARTGVMPASTSIWGSWPGAATAMIVMSGEFGADARLVAFMQYFRVACVAGLASIAGAVVGAPGGVHPAAAPWFPALHVQAFAATLAVAAAAGVMGRVLRIPSGPFMFTLAVGVLINITGAMQFELPRWLLTATFGLVGWSVGLHFTPEILAHAYRAFPKVLAAVAALILFSAGVGFVLAHALGIDPLTAYLATSPGAMESIAIVAASTHADMPFIITLQMVRFLAVIAVGPPAARFLARHAETRAKRVESARERG